MRQAAVVLIFVGALLGIDTAMACGEDRPVLSTQKEDGTKLGLFISQQQIAASQEWSPEIGEPPLGVSPASQLAKDWGAQKYARYDGVNVKKVSLSRYGCSLVSNRWYYLIDLVPVMDGNEVWGSGSWVAVLMDGTVIGPREY